VRQAIARYLDEGSMSVTDEEAELVVQQANTSIENMVKALDEAHQAVQEALASGRRR
jgi:NACalpha-BTF3-like transcription factor